MKTRITIRLTPEAAARLEREAARRGLPSAEIVRQAIESPTAAIPPELEARLASLESKLDAAGKILVKIRKKIDGEGE